MENENNESQDDLSDYSLINEVPEYTSTDVIMEMKIGIYNLFVGLYQNLMIEYGPIEAIKKSTEFLEEIIINFRSATDNGE